MAALNLPLRTGFGGGLDVSSRQIIWKPYVCHYSQPPSHQAFYQSWPLFLGLPPHLAEALMSSEMAKGQAAGGSRENNTKKETGGWILYKLNNQSLDNRAGGSNKGFCILQLQMLDSH